MDDIKLAMLGSKEAAKRLTDAGVMVMQGDCLELLKDIPDGSVDMVLCWHCGGTDIIIRKVDGLFGKSAYQRTYKYVQCRTCFSQTGYHGTEPKARLAWNTRAPILSESEMEMLDAKDSTISR